MSYRAKIPVQIESPNKFLKWHWSKRHRFKQQLTLLIRASIKPKPKQPLQRAAVAFLLVRKRRMTDHDNIQFSCKQLQDALVAAGIIADDSLAVIGEPVVEQKTLRQAGETEPCTFIEVFPMEDA